MSFMDRLTGIPGIDMTFRRLASGEDKVDDDAVVTALQEKAYWQKRATAYERAMKRAKHRLEDMMEAGQFTSLIQRDPYGAAHLLDEIYGDIHTTLNFYGAL